MITKLRRKFMSGLSLALVFVLVISSLAFADNTVADGDGVTPVGSNSMSFGTVCSGSTTTKTALIGISRNGNYPSTNVFKESTTVDVTVESISGTGLSAAIGDPDKISLPSTWDDANNNTISGTVVSAVTFVASTTPGAFSGSINYLGTGVSSRDNSELTRDTTMAVTATVVNCQTVDTTPPAISYVLNPVSADGANGWYKSSVSLTWTVDEPESPDSLEFDGCVDQIITEDQFETEYSCSATSDGGDAGPVTVAIKRDATNPTITGSASPSANGYGWNKTDVAVEFSCDDNLSGVATCGPDQTLTGEGAGQSVTGAAVDNAGNTASATVSGINIDKTAPTVVASVSPEPNTNGWNNTPVTVAFSGTDALSGLDSCDPDVVLGEDGSGQSASGTCKDKADNAASATASGINIDMTAPTITGSASPSANTHGWNNTDVAVTFTCDDNLSGVASCGPDQTLTGEGADQSVTGAAVDNAGNTASATVSDINIDKTAPTVSLVGGPAEGGIYYFGFVPTAPTCTASDALSGVDGDCSVSGYSNATGSHTVTATAVDKAGNSAIASVTYTVLKWTLRGFFQPVDMSGVYNVVKGGSTVPLKFEVFAGPTELTATSVVTSFVQTKIACDGSVLTDEIEFTTTGGTSLRYDATGGQFIQNWQTPKTAGVCYRVTMTTQDSSSLVAFFRLK